MEACKVCGRELRPGIVQQGGCHMGCYDKEITVYKIYQIDGCESTDTHYVEKDLNKITDTLYCLSDWDDDDGIGIRVTTMAHGVYVNLPEFEGF